MFRPQWGRPGLVLDRAARTGTVGACRGPGRAPREHGRSWLPGTTKENDFCHQHSPHCRIIAQFSMINGFHLGGAEKEKSVCVWGAAPWLGVLGAGGGG